MEADAQIIVNASANESDSYNVTLLLKQLNDSQKKRTPNGLVQSWKETQQAEEDSMARIFLKGGGFSAWFAYVLTTKAAEKKRHFIGQASCRRLIAALQ